MSSLLEQLQERRHSLRATPSTPLPPAPQHLQATRQQMHGAYFSSSTANTLTPPQRMVHSTMTARPGYATVDSSEYLDSNATLRLKVRAVAELLSSSNTPVLYTGAGISTASGIGDYASEAAGTKSLIHTAKRVLPYSAQPTLAHRVFAALSTDPTVGLQQLRWVQQNHDGLPQKTGFPQHLLNEIHGSWYDPSNPVIPMTGQLRSDLYHDMEQLEATADVVVALGTSLSGMNADRMVTTPAARGGHVVIVGLQQTQLDHLSTVRIFAKIDDFARMLCEEMQCSVPEEQVDPVYTFPGENQETEVYTVPYSREDGRWSGCENESDVEEKMSGVLGTMELDLSDGAHVVLTVGPHQGDVGEVVGRDRQGHYIIIFQHRLKPSSKLTRPFERRLGAWWVNHALEGTVIQLPIVNVQ